ncbi:hypothetical protein Bca101_024999 [Brassica carinata]
MQASPVSSISIWWFLETERNNIIQIYGEAASFTAAARGSVKALLHLRSTIFQGGVMTGEAWNLLRGRGEAVHPSSDSSSPAMSGGTSSTSLEAEVTIPVMLPQSRSNFSVRTFVPILGLGSRP